MHGRIAHFRRVADSAATGDGGRRRATTGRRTRAGVASSVSKETDWFIRVTRNALLALSLSKMYVVRDEGCKILLTDGLAGTELAVAKHDVGIALLQDTSTCPRGF